MQQNGNDNRLSIVIAMTIQTYFLHQRTLTRNSTWHTGSSLCHFFLSKGQGGTGACFTNCVYLVLNYCVHLVLNNCAYLRLENVLPLNQCTNFCVDNYVHWISNDWIFGCALFYCARAECAMIKQALCTIDNWISTRGYPWSSLHML